MKVLAPGANTPLPGAQSTWMLECERNSVFGEFAAVALLPVDDKRQSKGEPALLHREQPWMEWSDGPEKVGCSLNLDKLPTGSDRVLLLAYSYSAAGPVSEMHGLRLTIGSDIEFKLNLRDNGESSIILGEFYRRNAEWKFRALSEGSAYGLSAFGRRIGLDVDDGHPTRSSSDGGRRCGSATGTAFAVGTQHVMTCAHVIEDMRSLYITSFEGRYRAEPVVVDRRNDIALLRVHEAPALKSVAFSDGSGCVLGETVVALGFPLANISGAGIQVTQGGVSGLFGLHSDSSLFQFTAPIQPGSSGSPLFDTSGAVVGMVTSTITDAQNMNFAVKASLLTAFLEACRVTTSRESSGKAFTTTEITRAAQPSLWLLEASNT